MIHEQFINQDFAQKFSDLFDPNLMRGCNDADIATRCFNNHCLEMLNSVDPTDIPEELSEELERLPRVASSHQWVYGLKDCVRWHGGYGRSPETGPPCPGISSGHKDLLSHAVSDTAATSAATQQASITSSALGSRAD